MGSGTIGIGPYEIGLLSFPFDATALQPVPSVSEDLSLIIVLAFAGMTILLIPDGSGSSILIIEFWTRLEDLH